MANRRDPTEWMWVEACEWMGQAERLQRQFFRLNASERVLATWEPPVDVFEDERELLIVVAMPGVPADRVEVSHEPGALRVRGVRPLPMAGAGHRVRQLEIPYGAFERRIALPPGRLEIGVPTLAEGCLTLRVRKLGGR
jgi:HSP20 family molecular chaperone IbpA